MSILAFETLGNSWYHQIIIFECDFLFYIVFMTPETYGYPEEHSVMLFIWYSLLSIIPRHEIHKNRASETVSLTKYM